MSVVVDEIYNFRVTCEEHPEDALSRMEILQRKIMSDYPDALVHAKFVKRPFESTTFRSSCSRVEGEA